MKPRAARRASGARGPGNFLGFPRGWASGTRALLASERQGERERTGGRGRRPGERGRRRGPDSAAAAAAAAPTPPPGKGGRQSRAGRACHARWGRRAAPPPAATTPKREGRARGGSAGPRGLDQVGGRGRSRERWRPGGVYGSRGGMGVAEGRGTAQQGPGVGGWGFGGGEGSGRARSTGARWGRGGEGGVPAGSPEVGAGG